MLKEEKIVFVGAGSMAEAMISGLLANRLLESKQIWATNHSNDERLKMLEKKYSIRTSRNYEELFQNSAIVILAMKPKDVRSSLLSIRDYLSEEKLILSVVAGISATLIEHTLNMKIPVVRAMPNTSAAVGKSATGIAGGTFSNEKHIHIATTLFQSIGTVTVVNEKDLHAVTGVAGSGPAYVYYLAECMEESAVQHGLPKEVARQLVIQTFLGAAEMLHSADETPEDLRKQVMSPGGTTEAGIRTLDEYQFKRAVHACIDAAVKRSHELQSLFEEE